MGSRLYKFIRRQRPFVNPDGIVSTDPSVVKNITAAGGLTVTNRLMRVQGSGGAVTVTALPNIAANFTVDGYELILEGRSDVNQVELQDEEQLPGSGLHLQDTLNQTLGARTFLRLIYNKTDGCWYQAAPIVRN